MTRTVNSPVNPPIVPAFETLQDLGDKMGQVLTDVTKINTTVTIVYQEGSDTSPGVFLLGIAFDKDFEPLVLSFSKSLSLGDLASLTVEDSSFAISGGFSLEAEFGVIFAPDDSTNLKLLGSLKNESCTAVQSTPLIPFFLIYRVNDGMNSAFNETINFRFDPLSDCNPNSKLFTKLESAFRDNSRVSEYVKNISQVGSSSFSVEFKGDVR